MPIRFSLPAAGGLLAVLVVLTALAAPGASGGAEAAMTLNLPAPAGTEWEIIAGYNTATHSWADGTDPHAIDIQRRDGETAYTPLLAPISGTIGFVSSRSLSVEYPNGYSILLSHIFPSSGLRWGQQVTAGQQIGVVAPAGQAGNGGVSHIHIAVHTGNVSTNPTVPLSGEYAIGGQALPATTAWNAYAGTRLISRNNGTTFAATPDPAPSEPPGVMLQGAVRQDGRFSAVLFGGGSNAQLVSASGCSASRVVFWTTDADGNFVLYIAATAIPAVNAAWNAIFPSGIPAGTPLIARCRVP